MDISCAICRDQLLLSDDRYSTFCGHIFHFRCLSEWMQGSKTCPQCREKLNASKIHRIYFNDSSNASVNKYFLNLQKKVLSLEAELEAKENDVKHLNFKASITGQQVSTLNQKLALLCANANCKIEKLKLEIQNLQKVVELNSNYSKSLEEKLNALEEKKQVGASMDEKSKPESNQDTSSSTVNNDDKSLEVRIALQRIENYPNLRSKTKKVAALKESLLSIAK